ncbi:glypican-1 [Plakobranchus ocellatus]|uniref:Glypican-1 n=1 Tax=Plakobranchus ocellatus TaxID=259542 RepID=A0AAV4E0R4_9GAST|nr:glypican-1 [Plakobranchus ocellatus]
MSVLWNPCSECRDSWYKSTLHNHDPMVKEVIRQQWTRPSARGPNNWFSPKSRAELALCPQTETCCTKAMEEKLISLSRKEHTAQLDKMLGTLQKAFVSRRRKFDAKSECREFETHRRSLALTKARTPGNNLSNLSKSCVTQAMDSRSSCLIPQSKGSRRRLILGKI